MLRAVAAVFGAMKAELDGHLAKEEMVLFPLIRGLVAAPRRDLSIAAACRTRSGSCSWSTIPRAKRWSKCAG